MPSTTTKRWIYAAIGVAFVSGAWLRSDLVTVPEQVVPDLELTEDEIHEAEALSHFAWGLFLQMSSDRGFEIAADHYAAGLAHTPESNVLLDHLVTPYLMQKRFDRVEERLRPLAQQYPQAVRLNLTYAEALRQQERTDEAIAHLRQTLEASNWGQPVLLRELFVMLWREKRYDETEELLAGARRRPGLRGHFVVEHASAIFYSVLKTTETGRSRAQRLDRLALKHARRAVEKVDQAERLVDVESLASLLIDQENFDLAVSMLRHVREMERFQAADLILLEARALASLDRDHEAVELLADLAHADDLRPYVYPEMGRLYSDLGRFEDAVGAYERALVAYPEALPLRLQLAYCHLRLGQSKKGLAVLLPVKTLPPGGLRLMAHLYRGMGRNDRALEALEAAEAAARDAGDAAFLSVEFHLFHATLYEDEGRHDEAIEQARKALALDPEDPVTCNFLGYVMADHNRNLDEAAMLILKALEADPENDAYLDSLAWVRFRQRRFDEAHAAMNRAIKHGAANVDPVILDHAGDICEALGLQVMATWYWEEALHRNPPNRNEVLRKLGWSEDVSPDAQ